MNEDMYNRLDSIPACDRQTDRQTSCHGIVRAMHTRRAVKKRADCGSAVSIIVFVRHQDFRANNNHKVTARKCHLAYVGRPCSACTVGYRSQ